MLFRSSAATNHRWRRVSRATSWEVRSSWKGGSLSFTHFESDTRWARPRSRVCDPDSSMAMMDLVHVWFRPFRDELSLRRDDGRDPQKGKGRFRRKNGETAKEITPLSLRGTASWRCSHYLNRLALKCRTWATKALSCGSPRACVARSSAARSSVLMLGERGLRGACAW